MMLWIYRFVAFGLVGWGTYLLVGGLGRPEGLEILVPQEALLFAFFWLIFVPAAVNLINSFLGSRSFLLRWTVVVINAGLISFGVFESFNSGLEPDTAWVLTGFLVLLILSIMLARSWSKASKGAEGAV
jgi:hypothetical protein